MAPCTPHRIRRGLGGALLASIASIGAAAPEPELTAFVGARVFDGSGFGPATIVARNGRVEAVMVGEKATPPAAADRILVTGKFIIPGLVNAHGHVGETTGLRSAPELYSLENVRRQLALYARYGVTTVASLGGDQRAGFDVRDRQEAEPAPQARLLVAGPVITADTAAEARAAVDRLASSRPDFVKIRVDDNLGTTPKMPPAVYGAVIERAHAHGLRVAAHVFYLDDAKAVLVAGADLIAHSVRDRDVDAELIALLRKRDTCLVPTLTREVSAFVYAKEPAFFSDPFFLREADRAVLDALRTPERQAAMRESRSARLYEQALEVASRNLKALSQAGLRIAFGTDSGPPARFQGYFEHLELELMTQAGLTPRQVLLAATADAARCLSLSGRVGALVPGAFADFVVLDRSPLEDIANTRRIDSVWIAGRRVAR